MVTRCIPTKQIHIISEQTREIVFGHNGGVVYADDGFVIKWTGDNIINKLFKLKKVITYSLKLCEMSFEPNNLLNSLWYRAIQALNVSKRDSGPDPPNFLESAFDFTAPERDWSFLLMNSHTFSIIFRSGD